MAQKDWVKIKIGLVSDPKHRQRMGQAIWLYLHILDRADWNTGTVFNWKDEAEADDMNMPIYTFRREFKQLENAGYIKRVRSQYESRIVIRKYVNPRSYSGETMNDDDGDSQSEQICSVSKSQTKQQSEHQTKQSSKVSTCSSHVFNNHTQEGANAPRVKLPVSYSDLEAIFDLYRTLFAERFGARPTVGNDQDRKNINRLLSDYDRGTVGQCVRAYFESDNTFVINQARYSLCFFYSKHFNSLLAEIGESEQRSRRIRSDIDGVEEYGDIMSDIKKGRKSHSRKIGASV